MASCDPAALLNQVSAIQSLPIGQLGLLEAAAYCAIVGDGTKCDVQTLLASMSAFQNIPAGQLNLIEAQLLCLISTGSTP
jgi:hypothetical protein